MRRDLVLDIISNKPGIGFNEIVRQTKLSNGVISHYILQLLKDEEITKSGVRAKYFTKNISEEDKKLIIILSNPTILQIVKVLQEEGPLRSKNLAKMIGKSISTISINLKKMENAKIISRRIMNEEEKITSDIGYEISNKKLLKEIISKYKVK
mgnify:CR=1 FL=1|tara:strand:- start:312 stop:770 length:459 start_codon:yes stop_codon:yes gene_type:complete